MPIIKTINKKAQVKEPTQADKQESFYIQNRVSALYDAVIGSSLQVNTGAATHTTFASALSSIPVGGKILVLRGTYSESVTLNNKYMIEGQGSSTTVTGNFTLDSGSDYSIVKYLRFDGNLTLNSNGNFVRECFQSTGKTITDSGTSNSILVVQE